MYAAAGTTTFCWLPDRGAAWAAPVTPAAGTLIAIATSASQPLEPHP
jgi:hypothetical protein